MFKLVVMAFIQSLFLAGGQLLLKMGLDRVDRISLKWVYLKGFLSWQLGLSVMSFLLAMLLWLYMLKHYDLSLVYPLTSISYIFTTLLAMFFLGEMVSPIKWTGIAFIIIGVALLTR